MGGFMRALLAVVLPLLAAFCVFGFLASAELPAKEALSWRVGYAVLGLAALAGVIGLLAGRRRDRGSVE